MPINEASIENNEEIEAPIVNNLTDVSSIEVNDFVEIIPVTESSEKGEVRYALDDYEEVSSSINSTVNEPQIELKTEVEKEIVLQNENQVEAEGEHNVIPQEDIDPLEMPISEMLKSRTEERRKKMKHFNHKFNNSKIDDIEKIPAYKRQGLELEDTKHSSDNNNISRTTLGVDDNDDMQLRSNNSFLHDNVD